MSGPAMFNDPPVRTEAMLALFRTVQKRLLLLTVAVAVVGALIGFLVAGLPGVWGALVAAALGLLFMITTVAMLRLVAGRGPELLQIVIFGGWIVKMVIVVLVMLWLRDMDFYDPGVLFGTLAAVVLGAIIVEIYSVATSRIPYADVELPDVSSVTEGDGAPPRAAPAPAGPHDHADSGAETASGESETDHHKQP